jgi:hypothetical protein
MESKTAEMRERAEIIQEAAEERHETDERLRNQAAIWVAVLAVLLAISSFNTASRVREVINTNIHANSNETLFHLKNLEQRSNELQADELRISLSVDKKLLQPAAQAQVQKEIGNYQAEIGRLESDPESGEGKQQLQESMHRWEAKYHGAEEHLTSFESADVIYQIGIVLCSVCIVLKSRRLLQLGVLFGMTAALLTLNGFLLWVKL